MILRTLGHENVASSQYQRYPEYTKTRERKNVCSFSSQQSNKGSHPQKLGIRAFWILPIPHITGIFLAILPAELPQSKRHISSHNWVKFREVEIKLI